MKKYSDEYYFSFEGKKFGEWTVLGVTQSESRNKQVFVCQCKCNRISLIPLHKLINTQQSNSCSSCSLIIRFNDCWLDKINIDQAYFLGFVFADGSLLKRNNATLRIVLNNKDKILLKRFAKWLKFEGTITDDGRGCCQLACTSYHFAKHLKSYGIINNKTYNDNDLTFLNNFSNKLFWSWLHGYSDGDGYIGKKHWSLTAIDNTFEAVREILENRNIAFDNAYPRLNNKTNRTTWEMHFHKQKCLKYLPLLYQNEFKGLDRKYQRAKKLCASGYYGKNKIYI